MALCPFVKFLPVISHGGPLNADLGCIMHVTTNHGDPFNFFANEKNKASSHFWIGDDGALEQYVDTGMASWAQAAGNSQYVSVETSGTPDQPLTDAQVATFAKLYAWGHDTHGWLYQLAETPGDRGLGWHGMGGGMWGGHLACPGDLRKAQRSRILALAQSSTSPAKDTDVPAPTDVVDSFRFPNGTGWDLHADGAVFAKPGTVTGFPSDYFAIANDGSDYHFTPAFQATGKHTYLDLNAQGARHFVKLIVVAP